MSKKDFTEKEIKILSQNKYVSSITSKKITYTDEFKRLLIAEHTTLMWCTRKHILNYSPMYNYKQYYFKYIRLLYVVKNTTICIQ